jgi:hypothetical protein
MRLLVKWCIASSAARIRRPRRRLRCLEPAPGASSAPPGFRRLLVTGAMSLVPTGDLRLTSTGISSKVCGFNIANIASISLIHGVTSLPRVTKGRPGENGLAKEPNLGAAKV